MLNGNCCIALCFQELLAVSPDIYTQASFHLWSQIADTDRHTAKPKNMWIFPHSRWNILESAAYIQYVPRHTSKPISIFVAPQCKASHDAAPALGESCCVSSSSYFVAAHRSLHCDAPEFVAPIGPCGRWTQVSWRSQHWPDFWDPFPNFSKLYLLTFTDWLLKTLFRSTRGLCTPSTVRTTEPIISYSGMSTEMSHSFRSIFMCS